MKLPTRSSPPVDPRHLGRGKLWTRPRLAHLLSALLALAVSSVSQAQDLKSTTSTYPDRPLHLVVPFPAGGGADYWGRLVAGKLSEKLGQPVEVSNIPGAGGNNGTAAAARAAPDGYTLLLGSIGPLAVHQFTYATLSFAPERDFVPIALLESSPILLVASPTIRASSGAELIELVRSKPGTLSYASNGNGSPEHVAGELFKTRLKVDILRTAEIQKEIADEGGEAGATTSGQFATFLQTERHHWSALVVESGIPRVQ